MRKAQERQINVEGIARKRTGESNSGQSRNESVDAFLMFCIFLTMSDSEQWGADSLGDGGI